VTQESVFSCGLACGHRIRMCSCQVVMQYKLNKMQLCGQILGSKNTRKRCKPKRSYSFCSRTVIYGQVTNVRVYDETARTLE
jgi:hypothetical protein